MNRLEELGWTADLAAALMPEDHATREPARVVEEHRSRYLVGCVAGDIPAVLSGRMRHLAAEPDERPAVGDWVTIVRREGDDLALVDRLLPRRSALRRKIAGRKSTAQVVAANLDTVFVVTSMNLDLNPRRLERYLTAVWESGAEPVVVLTKSDLCEDADARRAEVESGAMGTTVLAVSALTGEGLEALGPYLAPGRTVALVGSSGVGKSTLVNRLAGEEILAVREIREDDDHGRHTTTHRQLVVLPGGGIVVDTPGMRELGLFDGSEGLRDTFSEVESVAAACRFKDCRHRDEPGCAVRAAIEDGHLDPARLASYVKLGRELAHQARKNDSRLRANSKRRWKTITKSIRQMDKDKGRG